MDRRERMGEPVLTQVALLQYWQSKIRTCTIGILQSFDATKLTCTIQPAIQEQYRDDKGVWTNVTLPLLVDVPVIFPGGGGFQLTFPLRAGDEGMVFFTQRCLDAWWQSGGVQAMAEIRMHDLSDGCFLPGIYSQPNKPSAAVPTTGAALRSNDGSIYLEATDSGFVIQGNVVVTGEVTANGIPLSTHKHGGVQVGGGNTGLPHA